MVFNINIKEYYQYKHLNKLKTVVNGFLGVFEYIFKDCHHWMVFVLFVGL